MAKMEQESLTAGSGNESFLRTLPDFPVREPDGHKGTYGLSVLAGGSRGMSGSIALSGRAALVAGSGLVRIVVPDVILETVAAFAPEYMTVPVPNDSAGRMDQAALPLLLSAIKNAQAVAIGPGLGRSSSLDSIVAELFWKLDRPLILDADALNALGGSLGELATHGDGTTGTTGTSGTTPVVSVQESGDKLPAVRILTPHPGEFARLFGRKISNSSTERMDVAMEFVTRFYSNVGLNSKSGHLILVLKGHETVITDGNVIYVNKTGNPGMATGGSGDVLTGILTGLISQTESTGLAPIDAARLGVALHGLAGDLAAEHMPMESILASDLIRFFPMALTHLRQVKHDRRMG